MRIVDSKEEEEIISVLRWFIKYTTDWRGSLIGNPNPKPLKDFDKKLRKAKRLLKRFKE